MVVFGPFRLDLAEERLWHGTKPITLRRKPFAILAYLIANPRRLVTYDELLANVWSGTVVSESSVRTHVHELRQALGENVIETVIGRGYRFVAEVKGAAEDPAPAARQTPSIVGRDADLGMLRDALERAASGHRQVCFITGEPGIGKSSLVDALFDELADRSDVLALRGHCIEQYGTPEAYLAVIEMLGKSRERVVTTLVRYAPTFGLQTPHLLTDAQLDDARKRARSGDAGLGRELVDFLDALAAQHLVVLALEDLQWSDVATIDLLALLGQRRERAKLFVIATARRAALHDATHPCGHLVKNLIARAGAIALPLERIATADIRSYLAMRFPEHRFPEALADALDQITAGTPLFLVSFVDDLVARGMIRDGALTVPIGAVAAHRPDSVTQLIDIQLDRLQPDEQRALEVASLVGIEHPTPLVAAGAGIPLEQADEILDGLARRSLFLRRDGIEEWPDGTVHTRYAFAHGLVRSVCGERSSIERRKRWHRAIAERLEAGYGARSGDVAQAIAAHYDAAQLPAQALPHFVVAAERTAQLFASADALRLYRRALDLLHRIPETPDRDALELRILGGPHIGSNVMSALGMASALLRTADTGREPLRLFERMVALARRLGDTPQLCAALTYLAARHMMFANHRAAAALCDELEELMPTTGSGDLRVEQVGGSRAVNSFWRGDFARARDLLERMTRPVTADVRATNRHTVLVSYLASLYWIVGLPDRALAEGKRAVELARATQDPYVLGSSTSVLAEIMVLRRDPPDEIRTLVRPVLDLPPSVWQRNASLVLACLDQPISAPRADELVREIETRIIDVPLAITWIALALIDALQMSGHVERALSLVDKVLAYARDREELAVEPELLRLRGRLRGDANDFREALRIARERGAHMLALRAAIDLARAVPSARAELARIAEAFTEGEGTPDLVLTRTILRT